MKNLLIIAILLLTFGACATTNPNPYPELTRDNVQKECEAVNFWNVPVLSYPVGVLRFDNCLNVKDLLIITSVSGGFSAEIRNASRVLVKNHYLSFLNNTDPKKSWTAKKLKEEREEDLTTLFYLLIPKEKTK